MEDREVMGACNLSAVIILKREYDGIGVEEDLRERYAGVEPVTFGLGSQRSAN